MSKKEVPFSWRCGEILSGIGHTYSVKYDYYPGSLSEVVTERVSRKDIRPCPPEEDVDGCVVGDVVEVFVDISWKRARILKVLNKDHFLVRLLGVPQEFRIDKSNTRLRKSWQDDEWEVIGKCSGRWEDVKSNKLSTSNGYKTSVQKVQTNLKIKIARDDNSFVWEDAGRQGSHMISSRTLKRASPYNSSLLDACTRNVRKIRPIEREGKLQRLFPAPSREKVDAIAYPRKNMGEKYMHSSSINRSEGYNERETAKLSGMVGYSFARTSEPRDSNSDECSVGSCSITSESPNKFPRQIVAGRCQLADTLSSDAESFYGSRNQENCLFPPEEELAESVHRLELHAYRCTLEALYASGPFSWEQEALLTNLRITLHISNDEHLMELRNLICAGTGIHNS